MRKLIAIVSWLLIIVLATVALFNLACFVKGEVTGQSAPTIFGLGLAVVVSPSMVGEINIGDLVIFYETDDYQIEDVITYRGPEHSVTHRIVKMREDEEGVIWYTPQGDKNNVLDDEITVEQIAGEVVFVIPQVGDLQAFLQTPQGVFTLMMGAILLFLYVEMITRVYSRRRRGRRR